MDRDTTKAAVTQIELHWILLKKNSNETVQIAQKRIQQTINQGGKEIEGIAPKIMKSVID